MVSEPYWQKGQAGNGKESQILNSYRKEWVIFKTQKSIRRNTSKLFERKKYKNNQLKELKVAAFIGQEVARLEVGWELMFLIASVDELYALLFC